jgi:signal peptidase I
MQDEQGTPVVGAPTNAVPPTPPSNARNAISWLRDLSVSVVIAIIVILFLYQPVKVEGTSMTPALINEERIFINKFVYRFGFSDIVRGDTIVFWAPEDPSRSYIKRVIGVPGDVDAIYGKAVFVYWPLNRLGLLR